MATIRRLLELDAEDFRAIRLEGLRRHPDAFGASFSEEAAQNMGFFKERLNRDLVFGGFIEARLLGVACYFAYRHEKARHKGVLYGMYVREDARGTGLANELVDAVLQQARNDVEQVQLTVISSNVRACRFYEKCGFEAYGTEPRSLKISGNYLDEVLMHLWLS